METNPYHPSEITEPAPDHFQRAALPMAVKVVAGLWLLAGAYSLVRMIASMFSGMFVFDLTALGIAVGIGLLFRRPGARIAAIICHIIGRLFSVLVIVLTLVGMIEKQQADASGISGVALAAVLFLVLLWMDRVLKRDKIKAIFGIRKPADGYGDGVPGE